VIAPTATAPVIAGSAETRSVAVIAETGDTRSTLTPLDVEGWAAVHASSLARMRPWAHL
jgi:hypothetical protein